MVSVTFSKKRLMQLSGAELNDAELADALLQLKCSVESYESSTGALTIEVTSDRPDLLSAPGVARALSGYLGSSHGAPDPKVGPARTQIIAEESALKFRPHIAAAIVRGAKFDDELIAEVFNQQEKITLNHGRKRRKVSIGLYDMAALEPPFYYRGLDPSTKLVPLGSQQPMTLRDVLERHPKGIEYGHIISRWEKFTCLQDSRGDILSLIPIINGISSAVTEKTTSFIIDATGTEFSACNSAIAIMCQDYADLGWRVEAVDVKYPDKTISTPVIEPAKLKISVGSANRLIGSEFSGDQMVRFLSRQRINAQSAGGFIHADIPANRPDFLHPVDLVEEIAMGHGFNNFDPKAPSAFTRGSLSDETLSETWMRDFLLGTGMLELSTIVFTNEVKTRRARSEQPFAEITNPISMDYHALRAELLPNLIEVISENTHLPYPQKIYEVGEVVIPDESVPERMRTVRHAAGVTAHSAASLTEVASILGEFARLKKRKLLLKPLRSPQYIEGRACIVELDGKVVGKAGEIHPQVLTDFGITVPAAAFEFEY